MITLRFGQYNIGLPVRFVIKHETLLNSGILQKQHPPKFCQNGEQPPVEMEPPKRSLQYGPIYGFNSIPQGHGQQRARTLHLHHRPQIQKRSRLKSILNRLQSVDFF